MEESLACRLMQELECGPAGEDQATAQATAQGLASTDPAQADESNTAPLGEGQLQQQEECTHPPSPALAAAAGMAGAGAGGAAGDLLHAVHLGVFRFKGLTEPVSMVNVLPVRVEGRGEVREGGRVPADARPSCCQGERERGRGRVMYEDA